MEMTANTWSSSAGGSGDWRSVALARAPQVVTFVLALAIAAELALILVSLTGRSRQTAPPPVSTAPVAAPGARGGRGAAPRLGDGPGPARGGGGL